MRVHCSICGSDRHKVDFCERQPEHIQAPPALRTEDIERNIAYLRTQELPRLYDELFSLEALTFPQYREAVQELIEEREACT